MKLTAESCVIISRYNPRVGVPLLLRLKKALECFGPCKMITAQDMLISLPPKEIDPLIETAPRIAALKYGRVFNIALMHLNETIFLIFSIFQLIKIGRNARCWIVFDETSYLACLLLRIPHKRIIYYAYEQPVFLEGGSHSPLFWIRNALFKKNLYRVGLLIAVNPRRLTLITRILSLRFTPLMVIRNVAEKNSYVGKRISNVKPIIFYQGRISPHTCENILFSIIEQYHQYFEIIVAGYVARNSFAENKLKYFAEKGFVKYAGYLPVELLEKYRKNASLSFVFWDANAGYSSLKYCEPNKLYELMASGIPVICTPNPTIKNIVKSYDIGWCLDGYEGEGLDVIMSEIICNPERLAFKSKRCLIAFNERFNFKREIKPLITYIEQIPMSGLPQQF